MTRSASEHKSHGLSRETTGLLVGFIGVVIFGGTYLYARKLGPVEDDGHDALPPV